MAQGFRLDRARSQVGLALRAVDVKGTDADVGGAGWMAFLAGTTGSFSRRNCTIWSIYRGLYKIEVLSLWGHTGLEFSNHLILGWPEGDSFTIMPVATQLHRVL